ncbi:MAG: hypothetical protein ACPHXR_01655 [Flavicella sp.]
MAKSIEQIWKEGFLKEANIKAPVIENLYSQKSVHIIDKFKRMFRINLIAILAFSLFVLAFSFVVQVPLFGTLLSFGFFVVLGVNTKLFQGVKLIDKGANCFEYLTSFHSWVRYQVKINERMARVLYPYFFMATFLGMWFKVEDGVFKGASFVSSLLAQNPDMTLVFGFPIFVIVLVVIALCVLALLGPVIYRWDIGLIYGRVFAKLNDLVSDMKTLQKETDN